MRLQVKNLADHVARLERRLTRQLWTALPPPVASRLRRLREAAAPTPRGTSDELARRSSALATYGEALDALFDSTAAIEATLTALPGFAPDPEPCAVRQPTVRTRTLPVTQMQHGDSLRFIIRELDREARFEVVEAEAQAGLRARFSLGGAPLSLLYQEPAGWRGSASSRQPFVAIATSLARGTARLRLRPEQIRHTWLLKPLGLVADVKIGSAIFDGTFLILAALDDALVLLTPEVRRALLAVARVDVPTLDVEPGRAELRWRYQPTGKALQGAANALVALRAVPPCVSLVTDELTDQINRGTR